MRDLHLVAAHRRRRHIQRTQGAIAQDWRTPAANPKLKARGSPMSTNEKKPRRTFDQDFIDGAVKLVTQEGYSLAAAAKAVDVL